MRKILSTFGVFTLLIFAASAQAQTTDSTSKGRLDIYAEDGIDDLRSRYKQKNKTSNEFSGYRVQIYNGRKAELLKKRSEFLAVFPEVQVYTVYDAPEYKLQTGDFRTRLEAEKFLKQVVKNYGSGFVVRTMIKPPQID